MTSVISVVAPAASDETRISTIGIRKAIAAKMLRAWTTIPHMTEYVQFDALALTTLRARLRAAPEYAAVKLTFTPFLVAALVQAIREYPILNSRWDEEGSAIVLKSSINVGIATDTERGLVVPVVHNAQSLSFAQLVAQTERLATAARNGALDARAMTGGTITLTNVGAAGPVDTGRAHYQRAGGRLRRLWRDQAASDGDGWAGSGAPWRMDLDVGGSSRRGRRARGTVPGPARGAARASRLADALMDL